MISDRTLSAVRERTDLIAIVAEHVELKRRGRSFLGLCPFHNEKTASFNVNPERSCWTCFGCEEHGGAIDFVMKIDGLTFPDAIRFLAERAGIEVEDDATDAERREANAARRAKDDLYAVNALAATFYEHSLRGGPGHRPHAFAPMALAELARRGVADATDALAAFHIGYAPHAWDGLATYLQRQGISPMLAERVGLLVPKASGAGHYDRFRHRLMFPVFDVQGRVIAFSGRALPEPEGGRASDEKPAKYINSPESPIYTKGEHLFGLYQARQAIRKKGEAVLVEGNFDVFSLHARGIDNVAAPLGTAFTEQQARLLKRFAPSVTVAFDGDTAGRKATWGARVPCRAAGLSARAVAMPRGKDPDAIAQERGASAMGDMLATAPSLTQRLLDLLLRDGEFEGTPLHDAAARARAAAQIVNEGADDIERAMLRSYADQLMAALKTVRFAMPERRRAAQPAQTPRPFEQEMAIAMFGALLDFPALLDRADTALRLHVLNGWPVLGVVALRRTAGQATPDVIDAMPEEGRGYVARRLAAPVFDVADDAARALICYAKKIEATRARNAVTENAD